jgi:hypothetical protein
VTRCGEQTVYDDARKLLSAVEAVLGFTRAERDRAPVAP